MFLLLIFIFISKISLAFIPGFPYQESFFIFQYGLHPFVNIFINLLIGSVLIIRYAFKREHHYQHLRGFKIYLVFFISYILFITLAQIMLIQSEATPLMQLGAAFMTAFTIYLYARVIPTELSAKSFIQLLKKMAIVACIASLLVLLISPATAFKGGRFIGVFKHIPYMVTAATLACQLLIYDIFVKNNKRLKKILNIIFLVIAFGLLILTGTRSALFAVMLSYFLAFIFFPARKPTTQFLKVSISAVILVGSLLFGQTLLDFALDLVHGQASLGMRAAQDGVRSRLDEVNRGMELFESQPLWGQGLLSKFGSINEENVGQYNAQKDPHNLLVSAGVIGGVGLMVMVAFGFIGLLFVSFKKLKKSPPEFKVLAIYVLTHMPILFIYHMHLSIGGMADRIYWLVVGYMFVNIQSLMVREKNAN